MWRNCQDIRNQRNYRRQRKQELSRLNATVTELRNKAQHYTLTIGEYESYVSDCMKHMGKARPRYGSVSVSICVLPPPHSH